MVSSEGACSAFICGATYGKNNNPHAAVQAESRRMT